MTTLGEKYDMANTVAAKAVEACNAAAKAHLENLESEVLHQQWLAAATAMEVAQKAAAEAFTAVFQAGRRVEA